MSHELNVVWIAHFESTFHNAFEMHLGSIWFNLLVYSISISISKWTQMRLVQTHFEPYFESIWKCSHFVSILDWTVLHLAIVSIDVLLTRVLSSFFDSDPSRLCPSNLKMNPNTPCTISVPPSWPICCPRLLSSVCNPSPSHDPISSWFVSLLALLLISSSQTWVLTFTHVMTNGGLRRGRRKVVLQYYFKMSSIVASDPRLIKRRHLGPLSPVKRPLVVALIATLSIRSNLQLQSLSVSLLIAVELFDFSTPLLYSYFWWLNLVLWSLWDCVYVKPMLIWCSAVEFASDWDCDLYMLLGYSYLCKKIWYWRQIGIVFWDRIPC